MRSAGSDPGGADVDVDTAQHTEAGRHLQAAGVVDADDSTPARSLLMVPFHVRERRQTLVREPVRQQRDERRALASGGQGV